MRSLACLFASLTILVLSSGCKRNPPPDVAAMVNGRPITFADIDKQIQFQFGGGQEKPAVDEQLTIQRFEVLRTLVDNEVLLQQAEKLGLMATDAEVQAKFNELRTPYTQDEFQRSLSARKMTETDLRTQIRRDLSVNKAINKEITSHITITDADVTKFFNENKQSFNFPEPVIQLAQIVVTSVPDPNVRNLKNDKAQTEDQARTKIRSIEARLRKGEDFAIVAQNFSEDPRTAQNGGDLGQLRESDLGQADAQLRNQISQMQPGQISQVIRTPSEFRILKLLGREPAGQRELNDPRVQQKIRETLINRKDQLLKAAYYESARNSAKVENFFAQSILGQKNSK